MQSHLSFWQVLREYDRHVVISRTGVVLMDGRPLSVDSRGLVTLYRCGKVKRVNVARLVLGVFRMHAGRRCVVRYLDGNPKNCALSNLQWKPKSLRQDDARRKEWYAYNNKNGNWKAIDDKVKRVFDMRADETPYAKIAYATGMSKQWVYKVAQGRLRKDVLPSCYFRDRLIHMQANTVFKGFSESGFARMLGVGQDVVHRCGAAMNDT